jgi:HK97 family phage prohead protease
MPRNGRLRMAVHRGAFREMQAGERVPVILNHDHRLHVGDVLVESGNDRLWFDEYGLRFRLAMWGQRAARALEQSARHGRITGCSTHLAGMRVVTGRAMDAWGAPSDVEELVVEATLMEITIAFHPKYPACPHTWCTVRPLEGPRILRTGPRDEQAIVAALAA